MILREWEKLPEFMKCAEVREYYKILSKKKGQFNSKTFL